LLSANSIKKFENYQNEDTKSMAYADSFVITNAEDLNTTDFACIVSMDSLAASNLEYIYDKDYKTLTIR
jgi:hypothetical protein